MTLLRQSVDAPAVRDATAFPSPDVLFAEIDQLEEYFPGPATIEIVGPRGVGKSFFCRLYRERTGSDVCDRRVSAMLIDGEMSFLERITTIRRKSGKRRLRGRTLSRLFAQLAPDEQLFWRRIEELFVLDPNELRNASNEQAAAIRYCQREFGASLIRASYVRRSRFNGLLDEGILKLIMGFLRWYPQEPLPDDLVDRVRRCLLRYPGDRNVIFLVAPSAVCAARQAYRGTRTEGSVRPHEPVTRLLQSLCQETGWRTMEIVNARI